MKSFKRIMLVVLTFILLFNLTSCNNNKYNAKVYSKVNDIVREEAFNNYNINVEQGETSIRKNRTLIINNKELYDEIFIDNSIECDFTTNIIYVYIYVSVYPSNEIKIVDIHNENDTVTISFKDESGNMFVGSACEPYTRWIAVKMDKLDSNKVEFIRK